MCNIWYVKKDMIAGTSSSICARWVNFKHSSVFSGRNQRWWEGVILSSKMTVTLTKTMTMTEMIIEGENRDDQSSNKRGWQFIVIIMMQKMAVMMTMRTVTILTTMTMFRRISRMVNNDHALTCPLFRRKLGGTAPTTLFPISPSLLLSRCAFDLIQLKKCEDSL